MFSEIMQNIKNATKQLIHQHGIGGATNK